MMTLPALERSKSLYNLFTKEPLSLGISVHLELMLLNLSFCSQGIVIRFSSEKNIFLFP